MTETRCDGGRIAHVHRRLHACSLHIHYKYMARWKITQKSNILYIYTYIGTYIHIYNICILYICTFIVADCCSIKYVGLRPVQAAHLCETTAN